MTVKKLQRKMPLDKPKIGWENIKLDQVPMGLLGGKANTIKTKTILSGNPNVGL
jgi:hypothetical protein